MPSQLGGQDKRASYSSFLTCKRVQRTPVPRFGEKTVHGGCQVFGLKVTTLFR